MANKFAVNDIVEVRFFCSAGSQYSINTRHFRCVAITGTSATEADLASDMAVDLAAGFKALLSLHARFEGLAVQIIRPTRRPAIVDVSQADVGEAAGDLLPTQTAGLIKFYSNVANRHGRGRMYFPFGGEGDNEPTGKPSDDYVSRLDTLGNDLLDVRVPGAAPNTATLDPVVYDRVSHATIDLIGYVPRTLWATQRRRSFLNGGDRIPF